MLSAASSHLLHHTSQYMRSIFPHFNRTAAPRHQHKHTQTHNTKHAQTSRTRKRTRQTRTTPLSGYALDISPLQPHHRSAARTQTHQNTHQNNTRKQTSRTCLLLLLATSCATPLRTCARYFPTSIAPPRRGTSCSRGETATCSTCPTSGQPLSATRAWRSSSASRWGRRQAS